eukprot:CAMPEP_0172177830 /NCGR_PEP_ID=MMETSP1050-20130122/15680_1 /TAXON_ID=233186 /ORGANISM="Cryptomonas curvata, Strain CCAP979/52" /LENGTH=220 /DNA_ID=CAMNT_0012850445 /DNA_START=242 /DNA_END=901 /DNA_ORIENTATION=+
MGCGCSNSADGRVQEVGFQTVGGESGKTEFNDSTPKQEQNSSAILADKRMGSDASIGKETKQNKLDEAKRKTDSKSNGTPTNSRGNVDTNSTPSDVAQMPNAKVSESTDDAASNQRPRPYSSEEAASPLFPIVFAGGEPAPSKSPTRLPSKQRIRTRGRPLLHPPNALNPSALNEDTAAACREPRWEGLQQATREDWQAAAAARQTRWWERRRAGNCARA